MSLEDFKARRELDAEFARAYRADLIRRLKAHQTQGEIPELSDEELDELFTLDKVAERLRRSGNPALAERYRAAWQEHYRTMRIWQQLGEPVTDVACELWEEASDAWDAAWEEVERVEAEVSAWLKRDS